VIYEEGAPGSQVGGGAEAWDDSVILQVRRQLCTYGAWVSE
jgi:hypothetical protein